MDRVASVRQITDNQALVADGQPRICVLSDCLAGNLDEGVKKFTVQVAEALAKQYPVTVVSTVGPVLPTTARWVRSSRTFLSPRLRDELRRLRPDVLIYATQRSATFFSFIRSGLLKQYCPEATVVLFGFQTRRHRRWQQYFIRHLRPDLICVQSDANDAYLSGLGCTVMQLQCGVDTDIFRPVSAGRRRALRARYGLDPDKPTVLHVGHLKRERGVQVLAEIAAFPGAQAMLATSSSTAQDAQLGDELRAAGVVVYTDFLARIEELYQLADCYLFPVTSTNEAIEMPLSVLEALACDLPVVTTRFGGLPRAFEPAGNPGMRFVDHPEKLAAEAIRLCATAPRGTRALVEPFNWDAVAANLIERALSQRTRSNPRPWSPAPAAGVNEYPTIEHSAASTRIRVEQKGG